MDRSGQPNLQPRGETMKPTSFALAVVCALLLCPGCATVRQAREVQRGANTPPGERTLRASEVGLATNGVLTLDEALRVALAYHPSMAVASQSVASARAGLRQSAAGRWPSVDAEAAYERSTDNTATSGSRSSASDGEFSGSLAIDWTLFDFGKTPAIVRQAYARVIAAEEERRSARVTVAYDVRTAFYRLCRVRELTQVAEEAVRQYRTHLEQVRAFLAVGRRTGYDVTKAEVDLGNAELDLLNARNELRTSRAGLNRNLGLAEDPEYAPLTGEAIAFTNALAELAERARVRHPDLRARRAAEAESSAALDEAIADLYPSLTLRAEYAASGSRFPLLWNWSAGLHSVLSVFNAGSRKARVEQAVAGLRAARARVADREQQLHLDLSRALSQLEYARQRQSLTDLIVRQAREGLELVNERYRVGGASSLELTDAQVALTRAQADQVNARFDYEAALAEIRLAMGEE